MRRATSIVKMRSLLLGALLLFVGSTCAQQSILLIDATTNSYLHSGEQPVALRSDGSSLAAVLSALSGLMPPSQLDEEDSRVVEVLVKPSPLKKPRAHMAFTVAGLSSDELAHLFGDRAASQIDLPESSQDVAVQTLASLAYANPEVPVTMLDYKGLQACSGNCIDEHMHATAGCINARHSDSTLTLGSGDSLDLSKLADKVFAAELASLYSGLKAQQEQADENEDVHMLEATLVGLQALEAEYGSDSSKTAAAREAVKSMLQWSVMQLESKYGGDITYQVAGTRAPTAKTTVADIMGWKQDARRKLAEAATPAVVSSYTASSWPGDAATQAVSSKRFTEKACGYGAFILLVYFSLSAVWCMCFMPFKQDTMLFGAKKAGSDL